MISSRYDLYRGYRKVWSDQFEPNDSPAERVRRGDALIYSYLHKELAGSGACAGAPPIGGQAGR